MTRIRILGIALVAVFAFSAVAASTASAKRAWWVCEKQAGGKFLTNECKTTGAGEWESKSLAVGTSRTITAKTMAGTMWELKSAAGVTVKCKTIKLTGGTIENLTGPTGVDKGKVEFPVAECTVEGLECKKVLKITVSGEKTELVENTAKTRWDDLFLPNVAKAGEKGVFAEIELEGGFFCPKTTKVEGTGVAAEIDATTAEEEEYKFIHKFKFPCPPIKEIIKWNGESLKTELKAFGATAEFCGVAEVEVLNGATKLAWDVR